MNKKTKVKNQIHRPHTTNLYYIIIGLVIISLPIILSIFGPYMAPMDPIRETLIIKDQVTGKFVKSPFPPFTIKGFPLGTDQYGRDILSRLLWAFRPTMILVLVVSVIRLLSGAIVGVISGWSKNWLAKLLGLLTAAFSAFPILLAALCIIAAIGPQWGTWGFILGLTINGWADSASQIKEQTRLIKQQSFIETATALGSSTLETIGRHVVSPILSTIWTILAFEISNTLVVVSALGFLGYFISSVWIPSGDFTFVKTSGFPELGEMLSSVVRNRFSPWAALAGGGAITIVILGFNLLGEGLRQALDPSRGYLRRATSIFDTIIDQREDIIEKLRSDKSFRFRNNLFTIGSVSVLLLIVTIGGYFLWKMQSSTISHYTIVVPGNHLWPNSLHDNQGTFWINFPGPLRNPTLTLLYQTPVGISGGPAVASDGTIYLATFTPSLYALTPSGEKIWEVQLSSTPVFSPAIGASGTIYVVDKSGRLTAISPTGKILWTKPDEIQPHDGSTSPPIVASDETIYMSTEAHLISITSNGEIRWRVPLPTYASLSPLIRLTPDEKLVLFEGFLLNSKTGNIEYRVPNKLTGKFFVSTAGTLYIMTQTTLMEFIIKDNNGAVIVNKEEWDPRTTNTSARFPTQMGISPDQHTWIIFSSEYDFVKLLWLGPAGNMVSSIDMPYRDIFNLDTITLIGFDQDNIAYICGVPGNNDRNLQTSAGDQSGGECRAYQRNSSIPVWKIPLEGSVPMGGALVPPGIIYITTSKGELLSIRENNNP